MIRPRTSKLGIEPEENNSAPEKRVILLVGSDYPVPLAAVAVGPIDKVGRQGFVKQTTPGLNLFGVTMRNASSVHRRVLISRPSHATYAGSILIHVPFYPTTVR